MQRSKRTGSRMTAVIAAVLLAALLSACGGGDRTAGADRQVAGDPDKIVAVFQGGEVNEQEFNRYYYVDKYFYGTMHDYYAAIDEEEFQKQLLQRYISFRILSDRAPEEIKTSTSEEVEQRMNLFEQDLQNYEEVELNWQEKSRAWGIQKEDVKQYIMLQATALNYIRSQVTEAKVQEAYDAALAVDPHAFTTATVRHVLVAFEPQAGETRTKEEALNRALEVKQLLEDGGDWTEVAKQYSDDPGSNLSGGRYVSYMVNDWVEPFKEAALSLPYDTISDPVETQFGYHIMMVEKRHEQTLEEVAELVEGQAVNELYAEFLNEELPNLIVKLESPVSDDQSVNEAS